MSILTKQAYRTRSMINLLRMGHCAPTVIQTVLNINRQKQKWLVRLTAGLPGGIGNTQGECGGITSPLIILGLRHGLDEMCDGLPVLFDHGHGYCRRFFDKNEALLCKSIQGEGCVQAVCQAPGLLADSQIANHDTAILLESRTAYARLYAYFQDQDFHCGRAVLQALSPAAPDSAELLRAASAFLGGTLFQGLTCSAFTAGVMAIGLQTGEIENSYFRVIRMLVKGMDILDEEANKFHRTINAGHRLSEWFLAQFGSTQCREITQSDFGSTAEVEKYILNDRLAACNQIAEDVASQVQTIVAEMTS